MQAREMFRWWTGSVLIWAVFGILDGTQVVVGMRAEGMQHPWARLFSVYALSWALWMVAGPLVLWLGRRYAPERYWPLHIAVYAAIGIFHGAWIAWLNFRLEPMGIAPHSMGTIHAILSFSYSKFVLDLMAYISLLAAGYLMNSKRSLIEKDEQLAQARLDALKRQLEPHFLFNALNGIVSLVRAGQSDSAVRMIARLGDLLRRVVDGHSGAETTLAEELEFLGKYLDIQQMRFASRMRVEVAVPSELTGARVPSMILQPIVENAIKHGIDTRVEGGTLRISALRESGLLRLSVENPGPPFRAGSEGVGISNTQARLKNLYGSAAGVSIRNKEAGLVEAIVTVPFGLS